MKRALPNKCCKQSPSISVINKLRQLHCVDNTCDVTRRSNKRP